MRKNIGILGLLCVVQMVYSANVTAVVTKYNEAELRGDITKSMSVAFMSETGDGKRIGADKKATLTWSNMPACSVSEITIWMRSNAKSGAADVFLSMNGQEKMVASGSFKDWPGQTNFSQLSTPITILSMPEDIDGKNSHIMLTVEGTKNSVFLDSMVITYAVKPPTAHTVLLSSLQANGQWSVDSVTESAACEGIVLPSVDATTVQKEGVTWYFKGWSEKNIPITREEPIRWEAGDWYYPETDLTLYAVYTDQQVDTLVQDTSFANGEYALGYIWLDNMMFLKGGWNSRQITLQTSPIPTFRQGRYFLTSDTIDKACRYLLSFTDTMLTIRSVSTGKWIGYGTNSTQEQAAVWHWKRAANGSIYLYSTLGESTTIFGTYIEGQSLAIKPLEDNQLVVCYSKERWLSTYSYWILFPTANAPMHPVVQQWTTFPLFSGWQESSMPFQSDRQIFLFNGQIILKYNNQWHNIMGQAL